MSFAEKVSALLRDAGIRVELDASNETLGKKIRDGKMQKIPYLLVIGDKEVESKTVTVETSRDMSGAHMEPTAFRDRLTAEIRERKS